MTTDAFTVLGLEPRFALDRSALDARHRELSRALHPDRYASAPAGERRRALDRAITVNHAYRALKDPITRAEALLSRLLGETANAEDAPAKADPMFLMEMMEQREALSEARRAGKLDEVSKLGQAMSKREREVSGRLAQLFDEGVLADELRSAVSATTNASTTSPPAASGATDRAEVVKATTDVQNALGELRYLRRYLDEVAAIEDELD